MYVDPVSGLNEFEITLNTEMYISSVLYSPPCSTGMMYFSNPGTSILTFTSSGSGPTGVITIKVRTNNFLTRS